MWANRFPERLGQSGGDRGAALKLSLNVTLSRDWMVKRSAELLAMAGSSSLERTAHGDVRQGSVMASRSGPVRTRCEGPQSDHYGVGPMEVVFMVRLCKVYGSRERRGDGVHMAGEGGAGLRQARYSQ